MQTTAPHADYIATKRVMIYSIAYHILGNHPEIEDIVQDTMFRVIRGYNGIGCIDALLVITAKRICIDKMRQRSTIRGQALSIDELRAHESGETMPFEEIFPSSEDLHAQVQNKIDAEVLLEHTRSLSPTEQKLIALRAVGYKPEEYDPMFSLTSNSLKSTLRRLPNKFRTVQSKLSALAV